MTILSFDGFSEPVENWSKLPHVLIDALPLITTIAEMKVVLYILRHTWGFKEFDLPKRITVDEFVNGRKDKHGKRLDNGTGLTEPSVRAGLEKATEHGFITVFMDDTDKARIVKAYMLKMCDQGEKVLPSDYAIGGKSFTVGTENFNPRSEKDTKRKKSKKKEGSAPSKKSGWASEDVIILEWARIRNLISAAVGATLETPKRRACARRMLRWPIPVNTDDIADAVRASRSTDYEFTWLEDDVPKRRAIRSAIPKVIPDAPLEIVVRPEGDDETLKDRREDMERIINDLAAQKGRKKEAV